jgi:valyl-tRNA synthetase
LSRPDVLDTWFSSALWPHSTLGWPDQTPELAKWYPTSVLLTGRDIITLWVARMVMMGMYNMGTGQKAEGSKQKAEQKSQPRAEAQGQGRELGIPFHHVAINPTILDEFGKRMSKTAGNGVDPVDIIDTHGADALRFTLTTMATETQDARMPVKIVCPKCQTLIANPESNKVLTVKCPKCGTIVTRPLGLSTGSDDAPLGRMTSDKFDLGRNFCTKLWNAFRFTISNLESEISNSNSDLQPLTSNLSLPDRWILNRFNQTVAEANSALEHYRFDVYARACYDYFWRDFCDWYVEAIKPALRDPQRAPQTANVLAAVLDGSLRLLHPIIPFITEILWWKLNEVRPQRGLPDQLECPPAQRLIKAAWPKSGPTDESAQHVFPRMQEIVGAIRNVRNDYKVDPKKPVTVHILPPGEEAVAATRANKELIENLALCTVKSIEAKLTPPPNSVRTMANAVCEIFIEDLVDADAEKQRIAKRIAELEKQIATLEGRLNNPGYLAKAPPHLVEQTKQELEAAKAELAKLKNSQV